MQFLEDLPDEILFKIFSNLESYDLIKCAQVSKRIRKLSLDASFWQKINLYGKIVPSEFIKQILDNGCKYLSLYDAEINGTLELAKEAYYLKNLNIGGLVTESSHNVENLLYSCHSFEKLSLSGLSINLKMFKVLYTYADAHNCFGLTVGR